MDRLLYNCFFFLKPFSRISNKISQISNRDFVFREEFDERSSLSQTHERQRRKRLSFCTTININAFRRILGRIVLASTTTRPLRPTISPSHFCKWRYTQRRSLLTASTGARPERNGVLSAGVEYSRRSINKTQRRKAKQRTAFFPARARFSYLFAPLVSPFRDLRRETALSHGFLPSYETRRTMRVSMLLPRYSRCSIGICHSCFAVATSEKALLTRSRWMKAIYIFYACSNFIYIKVQIAFMLVASIVQYSESEIYWILVVREFLARAE